MSLWASQNVETADSLEFFNSQNSFGGDAYSDTSIGDLPSDLPEIPIEKLLNLDRPLRPAPIVKSNQVETTVENEQDSDLDMFGDDDDLLQALDEDPTWAVVTQTPQPKSDTETLVNIRQPQSDTTNVEKINSPIDNLMDDIEFAEDFDIFDSLIAKMNRPQMSDAVNKNDVDNFKDMDSFDKNESADNFSSRVQSMEIDDDAPLATTELLNMPASSAKPSKEVQKTVSLRTRREIQLKPFTVEASKFKELIKNTPVKSRLRDIMVMKDDDNDVDFSPSNTQAVDEPNDDISTYQDTQVSMFELPSIRKNNQLKKSDVHSKKIKSKENLNVTTPSAPSSAALRTADVASTSSPIASPHATVNDLQNSIDNNPESDLSKYGLNQLILPSTSKKRDKGKGKVITFATKKKGSRKKSSSNTTRTPSRFVDKPSKDIFAFDFNPKPIFDLQLKSIINQKSTNVEANDTNTIAISDAESVISMDDQIEGYESPVENAEDQTLLPTVEMEQDEDEADEIPVFRHPRKRKRLVILESDEEDSISSEPEQSDTFNILDPTDDTNSIFDFPVDAPEPSNRHVRNKSEDNIVPIIEDEFEYKQPKRQRLGIEALKKNTLKNILPASFFKVNQHRIEEEERLRQQKRREAYALKKAQANKNDRNSSGSSSIVNRVHRDTEDVFAEFRNDSEKSDEDDHDNGNAYDFGYDYDDSHPLTHLFDDVDDSRDITNQSIVVKENRATKLAPIFQQQKQQQNRSRASTSQNNQPLPNKFSSRNIPTSSAYPPEAIETNRLPRQVGRSHNNQSISRSPARSNNKSSIAITRPKNAKDRLQNLINVKQNPAPKRRKRTKRTRDDIRVHSPYYGSSRNGSGFNGASHHQGGIRNNVNFDDQNGANNDERASRGMFVNDKLPRRPFDDIYMNTKQQMWYKNDLIYIGNYDISDYLDQHITEVIPRRPTPTIYTLQYITEKIRHLMDYELRRVIGLKNTVYWHHQLLKPLLTDTPNMPSAYIKFKDTYSSLVLFDRLYFWKHFHPRKKSLLKSLFGRVFDDLYHMCNNDEHNRQPDMEGELPGHDHFYVFISICLTQWIPHYTFEDKLQLVEIFANHIRGLAKTVSSLIEDRPFEDVPWKAIIKVMLFILDWTCRLHHLGIDRAFWSVAECIQMLMDWLVFIGYDAIQNKNESRDYVVEAWICIIQILSVSDHYGGGYFYNEHIFITQLTKSIKEKSRVKLVEFEKRKTTRLWAETLNLILKKHMML